jgi:hypothetical protein
LLTGVLEIGGGSVIVNITSNPPPVGNIGFVAGSLVLSTNNGTSGSFVPFVGDAVIFPGQAVVTPTQIPFTQLTAAANQPFVSIAGGALTFTLTTATETIFNIGNNQEAFVISGTGTFHEAGFSDTPGTFDLSTQSLPGGSFSNTSFSASAVAVPGPIVRAGIPGLVSLLGWFGFNRFRKRRSLA